MATSKTTTLTFRIEPALKEVLRTAAQQEHRSIANRVEELIRDYCRCNCIVVPEQDDLSNRSHKPTLNNVETSRTNAAQRKIEER